MVDGTSDVLWAIEMNGAEMTRVKPGESVVVGRKPIRPMVETEADRRVDIDDPGKSMSKRHMLLSVDEYGRASIEDVGSTNGSFTVRDDGALTRLPAGTKLTLRQSPTRVQLGDMTIELREVTRDTTSDHPVASLFDGNGMSPTEMAGIAGGARNIDQILDVRAGEPTTAVSADDVRHRAARPAGASPVESLESRGWNADKPQERKAPEETPADPAPAATPAASAAPASAAAPLSQDFIGAAPGAQDAQPAQEAAEERPVSRFAPIIPPASAQPAAAAEPSFGTSSTTPRYDAGSMLDRISRGEVADAPARPQPKADPDERVVSGYSVREVRTTDDYDKQFDMAQHADLAPFLAMNPYLYADLYSWLEALGDADVNTALASNSGYREWKQGK